MPKITLKGSFHRRKTTKPAPQYEARAEVRAKTTKLAPQYEARAEVRAKTTKPASQYEAGPI